MLNRLISLKAETPDAATLGVIWGMRHALAICLSLVAGAASSLGSAVAANCPGNPNALGVSRTIVVDPTEHPLLGVINYKESLPLNDREVVLTFDDGPLPPYTTHVLDVLAAECIKATFFLVGRMARGYPSLVKRIYADGHTLANHSQNHPFTFNRMSVDAASKEIEDGLTSIRTALGDPNGVSNFFRVPGLLRQDSVERPLASRGYQTWSVDIVGDDWLHIPAAEVVRRTISRLEARGKGIVLLHDIQPATSGGFAEFIRELKARRFKIVHVVQATPDRPRTETVASQWRGRPEQPSFWPQVTVASLHLPDPVLDAPSPGNFGIADPTGKDTQYREKPLPPIVLLPQSARWVALSTVTTPAPAAENFRYWRVWQPRKAAPAQPARTKVAVKKDSPSTTSGAPRNAAHPKTSNQGTPGQPPRNPQQRPPSGHQLPGPRPSGTVPL
jgi:peptidoglycan-N-acetylglucosamine deacetylase